MKAIWPRLLSLSLTGILAAAAHAGTLSGTVINRTTGKATPNIDLTLLSPTQGMRELGSSKSDAQGHFMVTNDAIGTAPVLVRATYHDVSYNTFAPPGQPPRCRSRKANVNDSVDMFSWLGHAATKFAGEATVLGQVCNKFQNTDASIRGSPHTLYVLKSNNKTPVQLESGAPDRRGVVVSFTNFKTDRPAANVFDVPKDCPPVPPVDRDE